MDLLGISDQTYRTYIEVGLLRPIAAPKQKRHSFSLPDIIKKFQLA
jgi:predicted site-specific integrase-resolvase